MHLPSSTIRAKPASVGCSKIRRMGISTSKAAWTLESMRTASREWPPAAKKSVSRPKPSRRKSSLQISASFCSTGVRGGLASEAAAAFAAGAGRARRSTLPLGVRGRARQGDEGRRHHVARQPLLEGAAEPGQVERPLLPHRDIGDEAPFLSVAAHHGHHVLHRRLLAQDRLDLSELDAEAADLDLVIDPAEEFEAAAGAPAHEIARPVEDRAGGAGEGSGRKLRLVFSGLRQ